jgi:hypothetical protein
VKTFEDIKRDGKSLATVEPKQLSDLLDKNRPS